MDYIALTLRTEGDQTQIEEQILQSISKYKGEYNEKIGKTIRTLL